MSVHKFFISSTEGKHNYFFSVAVAYSSLDPFFSDMRVLKSKKFASLKRGSKKIKSFSALIAGAHPVISFLLL